MGRQPGTGCPVRAARGELVDRPPFDDVAGCGPTAYDEVRRVPP
ncbi:hypothetical protein [Geodermatophilus obscurus]|nr:hypothetical protein [Geodermatophilus obscurus]